MNYRCSHFIQKKNMLSYCLKNFLPFILVFILKHIQENKILKIALIFVTLILKRSFLLFQTKSLFSTYHLTS